MRRAFTLIELLVVIGIILLVMGITVANFGAFSGSQRLKQSGNTIGGVLSEARSIAVTQRKPVRVFFCYDAGEDMYCVGTYYVDRKNEVRVEVKQLHKFVEIDHVDWKLPNSNIAILDHMPDPEKPEDDFNENGFTGAAGMIEVRRDGTIEFHPPFIDLPAATVGGKDLYDRNTLFTRVDLSEIQADVVLKLKTGTARCFLDFDANSGRAFNRVIETEE